MRIGFFSVILPSVREEFWLAKANMEENLSCRLVMTSSLGSSPRFFRIVPRRPRLIAFSLLASERLVKKLSQVRFLPLFSNPLIISSTFSLVLFSWLSVSSIDFVHIVDITSLTVAEGPDLDLISAQLWRDVLRLFVDCPFLVSKI